MDRNSDLGADVAGDALVVAAQDLHLDAGLGQRAHRVGGIAFRRIDKERKAREGQLVLLARGDRIAFHRARRDAEHAIALFAQRLEAIEQPLAYRAVERKLGSVRTEIGDRARQHLLRRTLHHEQPRRAVAKQHRNAAALEIEGISSSFCHAPASI